MKLLKLLKLGILAFVLLGAANASAECYVKLSLCKRIAVNRATTLTIGGTAAIHPNACLAQARSYYNMCGSAQEVGAEFYVNGILTISHYVNPNGAALWTKNANGLWFQIPSSL